MSVANRRITSHFVRKFIVTSNPTASGFSVEKNDNNISRNLWINNFLAESLDECLARSY